MALDIRIEATNTVTVPDDVAADLLEVYTTLQGLPSTRMATVDFTEHETLEENVKAARKFVRQAMSWATDNGLKFARKGDISGQPDRVSFRIYEPAPEVETAEGEEPPKRRGRKPKNQAAAEENPPAE